MVGGVFNTIGMLPGWLRWLAYANPLFYFINGLRHSMIGFSRDAGGPGLWPDPLMAAVVMFLVFAPLLQGLWLARIDTSLR